MKPEDQYALERERKIGQLALQFALACMAVVIVVLVFSMAVVVSMANRSQNNAEDLNDELKCRGVVASQQAVATAELTATVAEALVELGEGRPIDALTDELATHIETARQANAARLNSAETCADAVVD